MSQVLTYPKLFGLIGGYTTPLSQAMHNAAFEAEGIEAKYVNFTSEDTKSVFEAVRTLGICGLSVTIPHKEKAIEFVDVLSDEVKQIGALNTVVNNNGVLHAYNTDWIGVREAFKHAGVDISGKNVLVLGAGGAARGVLYALKQLKTGEVTIANRTLERAEELAKQFSGQSIGFEQISKEALGSFQVIINTTSIGLTPDSLSEYPFSIADISSKHVVFEAVMKETLLSQEARKIGACVIPGAEMLLYQAEEQFKLFTGRNVAPVEVMRNALMRALAIL